MAGSLSSVLSIQITQATAAVATTSFAIPLIVGPTATGWSDVCHVYSSPAAMLTDGFITSSPEYIYALELVSQTVVPASFCVGKRAGSPVAQVDTFAVATLTSGHAYKITVNGTVYSYTAGGGDTQQVVLGALLTAILVGGAVTGAVTGSGSGALLTLTGASLGLAVTYSAIDSLLTHVLVTPAVGIQSDLTAIIAENNTWYGLVIAAASDADILQAASLIESLQKIFIAVSATTAIGTSSTSDVGSTLQAKGYKRTALIFSPANVNAGIDAAWAGGQLPQTPGSNNWAFKTLAGIAADVLTTTQQTTCIGTPVAGIAGKNVNIYQALGGVNCTMMGTMAGGAWIDQTVFVDWLQSTISTNVFSALVNATKIPFTDKGAAILVSAVRAAIDQGVVQGGIDGASPITLTVASVLSLSTVQRAQRIAPTITFSCRLSGAINDAVIAGTVTV